MSLEQTNAYHNWYVNNICWGAGITYRGVPINKWVGDLWNYQQIICELRPSLIIEFGTHFGGSALWFADLLEHLDPAVVVLTVDKVDGAAEVMKTHPQIEWMVCDSRARIVADRVKALRLANPGPMFVILDSDHHKAHVLAEMELMRDVLTPGDYLIVEDGNINGHPVFPEFGEGPFEAITEYEQRHPNDYEHDRVNEMRFGFTFAVNGYLVRR